MHQYPKLLWSPDGIEITVHTAAEEADRVGEGYLTAPVGSAPPPPRTFMEALTHPFGGRDPAQEYSDDDGMTWHPLDPTVDRPPTWIVRDVRMED